jgi:YfiH family protein
VPVLLEARDADGRVLAVAAVHAGWRGTAGGIVVNAVKALRHSCGDAEIYAAIGPCIGQCCFEVDKDCVDEFDRLCGKDIVDTCFVKAENGKYYGDLVKVNRMLLSGAGVPDAHIDAAGICTCCHPDWFFSHRYATKYQNGKRGTMLSVICK